MTNQPADLPSRLVTSQALTEPKRERISKAIYRPLCLADGSLSLRDCSTTFSLVREPAFNCSSFLLCRSQRFFSLRICSTPPHLPWCD